MNMDLDQVKSLLLGDPFTGGVVQKLSINPKLVEQDALWRPVINILEVAHNLFGDGVCSVAFRTPTSAHLQFKLDGETVCLTGVGGEYWLGTPHIAQTYNCVVDIIPELVGRILKAARYRRSMPAEVEDPKVSSKGDVAAAKARWLPVVQAVTVAHQLRPDVCSLVEFDQLHVGPYFTVNGRVCRLMSNPRGGHWIDCPGHEVDFAASKVDSLVPSVLRIIREGITQVSVEANRVKTYNHLCDVGFEVSGSIHKDWKDIPVPELIDHLEARVKYLRSHPADAAEAFGHSDTYEEQQ